MNNKLRFHLALTSHPYLQEAGAYLEAWGCVAICIETEGIQKLLFETQWDLAELAEWFADNQAALGQDTLSLEGTAPLPLPSESLAHALARLQARDFEDEETEMRWFTALFTYRERHSLRFALRGARIPEIIIGCNNGTGEISQESDEAEWAYPFEMADFCADLASKLRHLLIQWSTTAHESTIHKRAERILNRLGVDVKESQ